ncbi:Bug family tripartite tricarboxylate transporter substrate binding protein [Pollutimonas nitritireducens]|nr:tripartite tricarboxylate transporter substrate binding protein [Pollutimonas nitritireducens]
MKNLLSRYLTPVLAGLMFAGTALAANQVAPHENYPEKPIRVILPFSPGSGTDIITRILGEEMRKSLGQPIIVESRAGANGFIAAEAAARAPADGYTLFITTNTTHSTNPSLFKTLPYDPVKDFEPIGAIVRPYYTFIVNNDVPATTLSELITYLKKSEGKTNFGWSATVSQLSTMAFLDRIGAESNGIPYKSSPQVMTDLIGGRLQFTIQDIATAMPNVTAGRVRALAVTSPARSAKMPDVPTLAEAGIPEFAVEAWVGMFAPAGVPKPVIDRLSKSLQAALADPKVAAQMEACCMFPVFKTTPEEFSDYLKKDRALWAGRIKEAGIEPQ